MSGPGRQHALPGSALGPVLSQGLTSPSDDVRKCPVEEVSASLPSDPPTFVLNTPQTPTALVPETLLVMERHAHLQLAHQTRLRLAPRREARTPRRPSPRLRGRRPR